MRRVRTLRRSQFCLTVLLCAFSVVAYGQWTWSPQTGRWINVKHLPRETAELQIEYARGLMLEGNYGKAIEETDKFNQYYGDSPLGDQNQFLRGEIRMAQGKEMDAAKEFQKVITKYPSTTLYDQVTAKQYEVGDKLYEQGVQRMKHHFRLFRKRPLKRAIEVYSMVINNAPFTDAAAEAQYKVGLCHQTRKEYVEAAFAYKRVIEDYSSSDWVDDASYGLAMSYYESSEPADYDQKPSQLAIDAINEFKQRFPNDQRMTELEEKKSELRGTIALQRLKTAEFYAKRRDFTAARIYYELVTQQFDGTPAADKARQWLADNPPKEISPANKVLKGLTAS